MNDPGPLLILLVEVYVALVGLVIGSYLNVVIYRLPRGISTILPRSRCTRCKAKIRAWDNVPLFSFLFLRGHCRHCGSPIGWRYPMVEALTAICLVAIFRRFEGTLEIGVAAVFCGAMIVLAMIDLEHYILPDLITKTGIVVGLFLQLWLPWRSLKEAMIGVALGAGVLYALAKVWLWWKGVPGMGMGDVKMLAMIGAFLGWQGVVVTLFLASLSGSLIGLGLMLRGRLDLQSKLPFGTFLAFGALLALFFGERLMGAYLQGLGGV